MGKFAMLAATLLTVLMPVESQAITAPDVHVQKHVAGGNWIQMKDKSGFISKSSATIASSSADAKIQESSSKKITLVLSSGFNYAQQFGYWMSHKVNDGNGHYHYESDDEPFKLSFNSDGQYVMTMDAPDFSKADTYMISIGDGDKFATKAYPLTAKDIGHPISIESYSMPAIYVNLPSTGSIKHEAIKLGYKDENGVYMGSSYVSQLAFVSEGTYDVWVAAEDQQNIFNVAKANANVIWTNSSINFSKSDLQLVSYSMNDSRMTPFIACSASDVVQGTICTPTDTHKPMYVNQSSLGVYFVYQTQGWYYEYLYDIPSNMASSNAMFDTQFQSTFIPPNHRYVPGAMGDIGGWVMVTDSKGHIMDYAEKPSKAPRNQVVKKVVLKKGATVAGTYQYQSWYQGFAMPKTADQYDVQVSFMDALGIPAATGQIEVGLPASTISVTNNMVGTQDDVTVTGLYTGDVVKVYSASSKGTLLGESDPVAQGKSTASVGIEQIGKVAGSVYVTVTGVGQAESARVAKAYLAEKTNALQSGQIQVLNNRTGNDTVVVSGLSKGDQVKLYADQNSTKALTSATASGSKGPLTATLSVKQLGVGAGSVYVTVTAAGQSESDRTMQTYSAEPPAPTATPGASKFVITNHTVGTNDLVEATGLKPGDVVKVYASDKKTLLGTSSAVEAGKSTVSFSVPQIGDIAGTAYVTLTSVGFSESAQVAVRYKAEATKALLDGQVKVTNNFGKHDTVDVTGLKKGDVIKVYDANGKLLNASAAVGTGKNSVSISISQLGAGVGFVNVSITSTGLLESDPLKVTYAAEQNATI
ncbi:MAG: hypothetical protein ACXVP5_11200 [Tumebacillaceae bacterium]